ncbi:hypothetical protein F4818DRAFT_433579 [Hypoxylon cercidicola]|nr:hypothetical protein F4818DRAFT_433579 [Hypoxylon cercidicola]
MAPITEQILAPIKPDASEDFVNSVLDSNTQTLLAQPGCLRVRRSRVLENPNQMCLFVDWASIEDHQAFAANAAVYGPFRAHNGTVVDPDVPRVRPYHVSFAPFPPAVLDVENPGTKANVAELLHTYFPADIGEAQREEVEKTIRALAEEVGKLADGYTGEMALGWSVEDDVLFKDEPSRVLVVVFGWTSVEAHMEARKAEGSAKVVPMLLNLEGLKGMEVCHVTCTTSERGS